MVAIWLEHSWKTIGVPAITKMSEPTLPSIIIGFDMETSEWGPYSFAQMNTHFQSGLPCRESHREHPRYVCEDVWYRSAILYSNCQNVTHHLATDWEPAVIDLCYITTTYNNPRESAVEKQFSLEISMQTQFSSCAHKERNEHPY